MKHLPSLTPFWKCTRTLVKFTQHTFFSGLPQAKITPFCCVFLYLKQEGDRQLFGIFVSIFENKYPHDKLIRYTLPFFDACEKITSLVPCLKVQNWMHYSIINVHFHLRVFQLMIRFLFNKINFPFSNHTCTKVVKSKTE